eukprot:892290_1
MKIILLSALVYLPFSAAVLTGADPDLMCNSVLAGSYHKPTGICVGEKEIVGTSSVTTSRRYECAADGSLVTYREYSDANCLEGKTDVTWYERLFQCGKSECPIFKARVYTATPKDDTCSKTEAFEEVVYPVNFCWYGHQWICDSSTLKYRNYLIDLGALADHTAYNCTSDFDEEILLTAGCTDNNLGFVTFETCTGRAGKYLYLLL